MPDNKIHYLKECDSTILTTSVKMRRTVAPPRPIFLPWATWMTANGSTSKVYAHPMTAADTTYLKKITTEYKRNYN